MSLERSWVGSTFPFWTHRSRHAGALLFATDGPRVFLSFKRVASLSSLLSTPVSWASFGNYTFPSTMVEEEYAHLLASRKATFANKQREAQEAEEAAAATQEMAARKRRGAEEAARNVSDVEEVIAEKETLNLEIPACKELKAGTRKQEAEMNRKTDEIRRKEAELKLLKEEVGQEEAVIGSQCTEYNRRMHVVKQSLAEQKEKKQASLNTAARNHAGTDTSHSVSAYHLATHPHRSLPPESIPPIQAVGRPRII